jgi:hypothetical protein
MKTVRVARILLVLLTVAVLSWVLPDYYWKAFDVRILSPRVAYSPVVNKFLFLRPDAKTPKYCDAGGREYTREEYERLLPLGNYRQLAASGTMPDSLRGVKIDLKQVALNNVMMRVPPRDIGTPQIPLFPLFESQSGRVKLEMPQEFFRIWSRMEFLEAATNGINEELSRQFTDTLIARGFAFPAVDIAGNPNIRKPFDEGYFVTDAAGAVFHLKLVKGKPFCVKTGIDVPSGIRQIFVSEMPLREFYGLLIGKDDAVYLISYDRYRLIPLPVTGYDPRSVTLYLTGDLFFRTITLQGESRMHTVVTDRDYRVVDKYAEEWTPRESRPQGAWASMIFPFTVTLVDDSSVYVSLVPRGSRIMSLVGIGLSLVLLFFSLWLRRERLKDHWFDFILVGCTGVFGLLAIHVIPTPDE